MELKGYSGCKLSICDIDNKKYVKKTSVSKVYNGRLIKQKEKQFNTKINGFLKCNVYKDGYEGDLYYFLMEYINGATLANEIRYMEMGKIRKLADILTQNMKPYEKPNEEAEVAFHEKIAELKKKININNEVLREAFVILDNFSWRNVVPSICHGDMTLQNILVKDNSLYLIDYLDSFYDSWQIDIAKVFQDTDALWSYKDVGVDSNLIIRLTLLRSILKDKILKMDRGEQLLETTYYIMLLHLLRIYPYLKDYKTKSFLDEKVIFTIKKIKNKGWRI